VSGYINIYVCAGSYVSIYVLPLAAQVSVGLRLESCALLATLGRVDTRAVWGRHAYCMGVVASETGLRSEHPPPCVNTGRAPC